MKLVTIGIGGSGASCIECLVHMAALGLLWDHRKDIELIPVMVDPDQQHPRLQATSRFISEYEVVRQRGGAGTDGLFGARIARIVNTNALRPSDRENLFSLIGLHQPAAKSLARAFFHEDELGGPRSREFANGFYGHVNAGVCFFNDPAGRHALIQALRQYLVGGDAIVVLVGSAFGGTGAAGLVHLARVLREDEGLRNVRIPIAAIQLEPYFKPDRPSGASDSEAFVNMPGTFQSRTGAAYQFLFSLAEAQNVPFDAFYPLGVRTPSAFPPEWFKRDQQDNPHLFVEYLTALAVRDFALNHETLRNVARHRREAVSPFDGPLDVLRRALFEATVLRQLLSHYVLELLQRVGNSKHLPGHPWIADLGRAGHSSPSQLETHFRAARDLLNEILIAAGIDRDLALQRAGASETLRAEARRKNELTRESFPSEFGPRAENLDWVGALRRADPQDLFASYDIARDGTLFVRALHRWVGEAVMPPVVQRHTGVVHHQWTQQEDMLGPEGQVLGITVPPQDEFRNDQLDLVLRRLSEASWRRATGWQRTPAEYPTVWAPALVHREELYAKDLSAERRYLHLGLLASVVLQRTHLAAPPVRRIDFAQLDEAFRRSLTGTFPMAIGHEVITLNGTVVIYESRAPLGDDAIPPADEIVGFFFPDTVVVPAAGMSETNRGLLIGLGKYAAGRGFAGLLSEHLAGDWVRTLQACKVPAASDRGTQFLEFLESFEGEPNIGQEFTLADRFERFPIPDAGDWIHRLYR